MYVVCLKSFWIFESYTHNINFSQFLGGNNNEKIIVVIAVGSHYVLVDLLRKLLVR